MKILGEVRIPVAHIMGDWKLVTQLRSRALGFRRALHAFLDSLHSSDWSSRPVGALEELRGQASSSLSESIATSGDIGRPGAIRPGRLVILEQSGCQDLWPADPLAEAPPRERFVISIL